MHSVHATRGITRVILAAAATGAACAGSDQPAPDPGRRTVEAQDERPVCLQAERYTSDGPVAVAPPPGGDAAGVAGLRWGRHEGCERFVIDLAAGNDAPAATPGMVTADMMRGLGILRVHLREIDRVASDATDATFDGPLARAAYVVRPPGDPGTWVDLHLGEPAEAAVLVLDEPARVVVDLRPGGGMLPAPAPIGDRVVVLEPRPGRASYPLVVIGYARTFEANVVARLERDGEDVVETFTTSTGWVDAWGHYTITIRNGPRGPVRLHVGEYSARDGTWDGVAVDLEMR